MHALSRIRRCTKFKTKIKKQRRKQKERWVRLSSIGSNVIPYFLKAKKLPDWMTWTENLIRWAERAGLDPDGPSPKTTRKTWESWLVFRYPQQIPLVFLSHVHTSTTALEHYLNMPFTEEDRIRMKPWVEEWV